VIALHAVSKRYGLRAPVLRDVDLELPGGTLIGVEGENGAGKSTLLRLVAGVSVPSRGRVERSRELLVGYAPEGFAAAAGLTGRRWLLELARVRGGGNRGEAVAAALGAMLDRPLTGLSHGQRQRVALASALAGEPDAIVLDEPTAGLDDAARAALNGLLRAAASRGALVLAADHVGLPGAFRRLRVHDGGVEWLGTEEVASRQMRVVATGPAPSRETPGLVGLSRAADGVWVAVVDADASDALLAAALAAGASVREVGPA
jgi:energy-coupling factor transporter ATP-binding protein EcfA2